MDILVTGGNGFIGRAVVKKLLSLKEIGTVTVLDNLLQKIHGKNAVPFDHKDDRVIFIKGDVTERKDIEPLLTGTDAVIHLAAETGTGQSMYDIEEYNRVNISGTALMLDVLTNKKHRVKKIIVASSRAIYGEGKYECKDHGAVFPESRSLKDMSKSDFEVKCPKCGQKVMPLSTSEDSLIHPVSFYGLTKQFQESIIMTLCPNIGIAAVALRFQNVYGPGQSLNNPYTGILSIFSNLIRSGKDINIFEDGTESRDFIYIDDVAEATAAALLKKEADNNVINIGSGKMTSVAEIAKKLVKKLSGTSKMNISGNFRAGDIRHCFADMAKAKQLLGFKPSIDLDEGLSRFTAWVLKNPIGQDLYDRSIKEMKEKGLYI